MIDFPEAMLIVHGEVAPTWGIGSFYVDPTGLEDARSYAVFFGPREWIVDQDPMFLPLGTPVAFVDKETGEVALEAHMLVFDRLDAMTKVSLTKAEITQYTNDVERRAE
jgi:hypothetical protein